MVFTHRHTQNWSRAFTVWINDIQVVFPAQAVVRVIRGGFLRRVRTITRGLAAVITVFFSLHCTRPQAAMPASTREPFSVPLVPGLFASGLGGEREGSFGETGLASWYGDGDGFEDMETASGEPLRPEFATCAHRNLPFGTILEIENLENGRRALARVNDRGPFVKGRVIDVNVRAARELGIRGKGVVSVRLRTVVPEGWPLAMAPRLSIASAPRVEPPKDTPVSLALDVSTRIEAPLLRLVAGTFWWLLGTLPTDDGFPRPAGSNHGRPPYLHRETT